MKNMTIVLAILFASVFLMSNAHAQRCKPKQEISDCYPALIQQGAPSPTCCNELGNHTDCFCEYINIHNPEFQPPNYQFLRSLWVKACVGAVRLEPDFIIAAMFVPVTPKLAGTESFNNPRLMAIPFFLRFNA
ncbi:hypothetical protein L6452_38091 [Arctium lappa]|uniref:Uncharacterized protein n=1 Tax=Arctium lappa TaxID=4217 RepID=A0ACB8Y597_ARCLA|nr:hypothetical protein L6452_38091 [Arctium lappa]